MRELYENDGGCDGLDRPGRIQIEAQRTTSLADKRRNCSQLQPFDVILCRPDEALENFLQIYPG